ncbi:LysR substrate-binding domain-containing protein [Vibrio coralliilyticus]|uniref:LysR substrate-binding domain-containing protein n=1 Tax=Vibrio coralliilyticus TaxID=190893 RepID=UPI00211C0A7E|nr:LysR substrate-binding domain-containing protein [Vibrio coralliilyticus]
MEAQQVLAQFDKLYSQLDAHNQTVSQPLRVTTPQGFTEELLSPLFPAFHAQYPEIQIDLLVTNQKLDLVEQAIDIAFRASTLDDTGLYYNPLMSLSSAVKTMFKSKSPRLTCLIWAPAISRIFWRHLMFSEESCKNSRGILRQNVSTGSPVPR